MTKIIKKKLNESVSEKITENNKKPWYKQLHIRITAIIIVIMMLFNYNYAFVLVHGDSMYPNYEDGNLLFSDKHYNMLYRFDVVVIGSEKAENILIKRVIGLPGDKVEYINNQLFVNGEYIEDMYGSGNTNGFSIVVEDGSYFCLGDNREHSLDSRTYGSFKEKEIIARVRGRRYVKLGNNPLY